jgi:ABC-type transport system involved in cytochrome bd biosynthesis fused ATPase/permease subunit
MKETLLSHLKGKTILMPTHAVKFASMADEIILMEKGRIVRKGHFSHIAATPEYQRLFLQEQQKAHEEEQD